MEFKFSDRCTEYRERLLAFMDEWIYPNETVFETQVEESRDPHFYPPILDTLKT